MITFLIFTPTAASCETRGATLKCFVTVTQPPITCPMTQCHIPQL